MGTSALQTPAGVTSKTSPTLWRDYNDVVVLIPQDTKQALHNRQQGTANAETHPLMGLDTKQASHNQQQGTASAETHPLMGLDVEETPHNVGFYCV